MDAWKVAGGLHAALGETRDDRLAVGAFRQSDNVDEPRANVVVVILQRQLEPFDVVQQEAIARRDGGAARKDRGQLFELPDPDGGANVVDPIVEAESRMVEPAAAVGAPLVAKRR